MESQGERALAGRHARGNVRGEGEGKDRVVELRVVETVRVRPGVRVGGEREGRSEVDGTKQGEAKVWGEGQAGTNSG